MRAAQSVGETDGAPSTEPPELIGRDVTAKVRDVPALSDEEVKAYSETFNAALTQLDLFDTRKSV